MLSIFFFFFRICLNWNA